MGPDARVWQLAEKAARDRQAPREVQQVRRLNKARNASTMQMGADDGRRIVQRHTQEDVTEQQALYRLKAIRDSAQYTLNVSERLAELGAMLRYEGSAPTRQRHFELQISKLMRRVMGTRKVVVLHTKGGGAAHG